MEKVNFYVSGEPQGKARPRVVGGHAYTPHKTESYEHAIRTAYRAAVIDRLPGDRSFESDQPLMLRVICFYKVPTRVTKARRASMISFVEKPRKKPDIDNVLKVIADALNGLAYKDDSQIVTMYGTKYWGEVPGVVIELSAEVGR